ncbi:bacillithiol system redox-active protein YtxJ [Lutibacter sp. TH_r2]|uniref:bacillithiol system redox-active protein YtxJ n=1 Tax=Lutibacter sp. TH_r2 TaxID=3082083 RepID=UPI002954BC96|nr:bacillithiol system redox-active protein YtxJ [Lutibacter sp. TH_r2]MDV7188262.1 bacillithiol system redox-active protein YtxJ [Lutibacter sp. TH_r2]
MNWKLLENSTQLDTLLVSSESNPVLLFKHSTRCGISRFVLKNFERSFDFSENEIETYFLDLIKFRAISNEIAERFNVHHQSPQVIVLKNREVVYHDSHNGISVKGIKKAIG